MEIQNWMRGLGYPESVQEFRDLSKSGARPEKSYKMKVMTFILMVHYKF